MAPTLYCHCCKLAVEEHKILVCHICKNNYNHACVDMTASEVRTIKTKRGLNWTCNACASIGNDIADLKAVIVALKDEVNELRRQTASSANNVVGDDVFEELLAEFRDREARKHNVIVFGVPEDNTLSVEDRNHGDTAVCREILTCVGVDSNATPTRLGKHDLTRTTPRPIRMVMENGSLVRDVMRKVKNLKNNPRLANVSVSYDRTRRQIRHYKTLKTELEHRVANGESLRIKYVRGTPKIVSLN